MSNWTFNAINEKDFSHQWRRNSIERGTAITWHTKNILYLLEAVLHCWTQASIPLPAAPLSSMPHVPQQAACAFKAQLELILPWTLALYEQATLQDVTTPKSSLRPCSPRPNKKDKALHKHRRAFLRPGGTSAPRHLRHTPQRVGGHPNFHSNILQSCRGDLSQSRKLPRHFRGYSKGKQVEEVAPKASFCSCHPNSAFPSFLAITKKRREHIPFCLAALSHSLFSFFLFLQIGRP